MNPHLPYRSSLEIDQIFNNPIWHALNSGNGHLSHGNVSVKTFKRDVAIFSGLQKYDSIHLDKLASLIPNGANTILFSPILIPPHKAWKIEYHDRLTMMIYLQDKALDFDNERIRSLSDEHIDGMSALAQLTKPGPFFSRTIDFGHYEGIFDRGQLVSMAGLRLNPYQYHEISAVCTHPDHTGKGYASKLLKSQVNFLLDHDRVPFLHLLSSNTIAMNVYKRIGFEIGTEMHVYSIRKLAC